jgi:hypothetical protein
MHGPFRNIFKVTEFQKKGLTIKGFTGFFGWMTVMVTDQCKGYDDDDGSLKGYDDVSLKMLL